MLSALTFIILIDLGSSLVPANTTLIITQSDENTVLNVVIWVCISVFFSAGTLFGNILVVLSVLRETSLQSATNYFIVSLAVADISLASIVVPVQGWREATGQDWPFSMKFCDIFIMLDVMFCTASILNLAAISLDRWVAVTRPIKYSKHSNDFRVRLTIAFVWFLSFLIALPIACGLNEAENRDVKTCAMHSPEYIISSSLGSFYIPCIVMVFLYSRVFRAIRNRALLRTKTKFPKDTRVLFLAKEKEQLNTKIEAHQESSNLSECTKNLKQTLQMLPNGEGIKTDVKTGSIKFANETFKDKDREFSSYEDLHYPISVNSDEVPIITLVSPNHFSGSPIITSKSSISSYVENEQRLSILKNEKDFSDVTEFTQQTKLIDERHNYEGKILRFLCRNFYSKISVTAENVHNKLRIFPDSNELIKHHKKCIKVEKRGIRISNRFPRLPNHSATCLSFKCCVLASSTELRCTCHTFNCAKKRKLFGAKNDEKTTNMRKICNLLTAAMCCINRKRKISTSHKRSFQPSNQSQGSEYSIQANARTAKKEKKATKTLVIVLGIFLFCWVPFFSINMIDAFCIKLTDVSVHKTKGSFICNIPKNPKIFITLTWLGYVNSFMNPIIYTIFNVEFRKSFKKLLSLK